MLHAIILFFQPLVMPFFLQHPYATIIQAFFLFFQLDSFFSAAFTLQFLLLLLPFFEFPLGKKKTIPTIFLTFQSTLLLPC